MPRAADCTVEKNIQRVDLLKIDAERMDLKIVKGYDSKIALVRLIQFEGRFLNISSHDLPYDFSAHLSQNGLVLGMICQRHVHFSEHTSEKETFRGGNNLAVRKQDEESRPPKSGERSLCRLKLNDE